MEKMDLSSHQCGMLELTCLAVIGPFKRIFCMKIVESQGKEQKDEEEGDVALFFIRPSHRIPSSHNIREI
jgi:hypothetical protein